MLQAEKPSILLIEPDGSLRRLIALGLQHRGLHVIDVATPAVISTMSELNVHVLILDIDSGIHSDWSLMEEARAQPGCANLPMIALTWQERAHEMHRAQLATLTVPEMCYLIKPFDARALYTMIEQLLAVRASQEALVVAQAEALLLASYEAQTSPSMWPLLTAIGLLCVFIGFLLQFAITVVGILIIIVSLLLWTLGGKAEQPAMVVG